MTGADHPPIPANVPVYRRVLVSRLPGRADRADPLRHPGLQHRPPASLRGGPRRDHPGRHLGRPGRVRHRRQLAPGRMGGHGSGLRHPGTTGRRDDRGVPTAVERGGRRAPRRVLRLRPGDVRAQADPGPVALAPHRRRRSGGDPPRRHRRRRLDPHEPLARGDPGATPRRSPSCGTTPAVPIRSRSPWAVASSSTTCAGGPISGSGVRSSSRSDPARMPSRACGASPTRSCRRSASTRSPTRRSES